MVWKVGDNEYDPKDPKQLKEYQKAYAKQWREANKDKWNAYIRKANAKAKEDPIKYAKRQEISAEWRQNNIEHLRVYQRERQRERYRDDPEYRKKKSEYMKKRYAMKKEQASSVH